MVLWGEGSCPKVGTSLRSSIQLVLLANPFSFVLGTAAKDFVEKSNTVLKSLREKSVCAKTTTVSQNPYTRRNHRWVCGSNRSF